MVKNLYTRCQLLFWTLCTYYIFYLYINGITKTTNCYCLKQLLIIVVVLIKLIFIFIFITPNGFVNWPSYNLYSFRSHDTHKTNKHPGEPPDHALWEIPYSNPRPLTENSGLKKYPNDTKKPFYDWTGPPLTWISKEKNWSKWLNNPS